MRVAFAGTPEFALPALHALARSSHHVVGVLTQPDRPRGRGQRVTASPVKEAAQSYGFPIAQPPSLRAETDRAQLVEWRPAVLIVVAYGLILPPAALQLPSAGCVNIHASLLPRWRGAAPIQRALLAGDRETGVTIMLMEAGLDTGPILLQRPAVIAAGETAASLHDRLAAIGAEALLEALQGLQAGTIRPRAQPAEGVTYASKIDKAEAVIDWRDDAGAIERKVRAFNPWPIAETRLENEQLRVHAARASRDEAPDVTAGTIVSLAPDGIRDCCGSGSLLLTEVQRPGRRPISARELAGSMSLVGRVLG